MIKYGREEIGYDCTGANRAHRKNSPSTSPLGNPETRDEAPCSLICRGMALSLDDGG